MSGVWGGSSGFTSASRIKRLLDFWITLPDASQTSGRFSDLWSSRAVHYLDTELPYVIGGGEGNSAAGWSSYVYRLYGTSRNLSSGGTYDSFGLPDQPLLDFRADRTALQAATSAVSGTTDGDHGRRVFQFLVSTVIDNTRYRRGGPHQEILIAWAGAGSSAAPSTV